MSRWNRVIDVLWWTWWHLGHLFDPLFWPERHRVQLARARDQRLAWAQARTPGLNGYDVFVTDGGRPYLENLRRLGEGASADLLEKLAHAEERPDA